uniref:Uncharacterized protein n=1 Tax=Glossina austeni TaxID=7395 RepID=A0A1A9US22_GLOAU
MKIDEVRKVFCGDDWEVVGFSKAWGNSHVSSNSVKILGHTNMKLSRQFQLADISHPALISVALNTYLRKANTFSEFYDYNVVDTRALRSRIAACDFNGIYNISEVEDQINILNAGKTIWNEVSSHGSGKEILKMMCLTLKETFYCNLLY